MLKKNLPLVYRFLFTKSHVQLRWGDAPDLKEGNIIVYSNVKLTQYYNKKRCIL